MNINQVNHSIPTIQRESPVMIDQLTNKTKQLQETKQSPTQNEVVITRKNVKSTVENLNDISTPERTNLKFVYHEDLHEYYVTVVNPLTHEVIREIPPEKMLDMFAAMAEHMGILVDERI